MKNKFIYLIKDNVTNYYKIGISDNPNKRLQTLNSSNPNKLQILYTKQMNEAREIEKYLHNEFRKYKIAKKEWFKFEENDKLIIHQIECVISIFEEKERIKREININI